MEFNKPAEALPEFSPGRDLRVTIRLTWGSLFRVYLGGLLVIAGQALASGLKARVI